MNQKNFFLALFSLLISLILCSCDLKTNFNSNEVNYLGVDKFDIKTFDQRQPKTTIDPQKLTLELQKQSQSPNSAANASKKGLPPMEIDPNKSYSAVIETEVGKIIVGLNADKTPITVNNFVHLAKKHFYDGTIFHRVIKNFMIQGGDPNADGTGGPGYTFNDEPFEGEYKRGMVAMANSGPNTNGSQFFIIHKDYEMPKKYVIFGKVTEGMEVVDKIATAQTTDNGSGENSKPIDPVKIISIQVSEK